MKSGAVSILATALWVLVGAVPLASAVTPEQEAQSAKSALGATGATTLPPPIKFAPNSPRKFYEPPEPSGSIQPFHSVPKTALRYNGGYVQHHPHVFLTFWGKEWNEKP